MSLTNYLQQTRAELRHVNWPTRAQAISYTITVIVASVLTALLLAASDVLFTGLISRLII